MSSTDRHIYVVTIVRGAATTGALGGPISMHRLLTGLRLKPETVVWASRPTVLDLVLLLLLLLLLLLCTMASSPVVIRRGHSVATVACPPSHPPVMAKRVRAPARERGMFTAAATGEAICRASEVRHPPALPTAH